MDEHGTIDLPVKGGKWFEHMTMGKSITNYDSLVVLTHFKEHFSGGFGGSNKNIGIGCADGRIGKAMIHTYPGQGQWSIKEEEFSKKKKNKIAQVTSLYKNNGQKYINDEKSPGKKYLQKISPSKNYFFNKNLIHSKNNFLYMEELVNKFSDQFRLSGKKLDLVNLYKKANMSVEVHKYLCEIAQDK